MMKQKLNRSLFLNLNLVSCRVLRTHEHAADLRDFGRSTQKHLLKIILIFYDFKHKLILTCAN